MVEKGMSCVKYLLFAFNLLFFIFGLVLMGVGIYVQVQLRKYFDFFDSDVNAPAILIIVVGVITLIVGFFGCCGAVKENYCMTMTFAALIGILLVCEIGGGIAGYVLKGKLEKIINDGMSDTMGQYKPDGENEGVTATWNLLQKELKCCGTNGAQDWLDHKFKEIPSSCCEEQSVPCSKAKAYDDGCLGALEKKVESNIIAVAGVAVGLGVVELIGIVLACCLGRAIKNEDSYA